MLWESSNGCLLRCLITCDYPSLSPALTPLHTHTHGRGGSSRKPLCSAHLSGLSAEALAEADVMRMHAEAHVFHCGFKSRGSEGLLQSDCLLRCHSSSQSEDDSGDKMLRHDSSALLFIYLFFWNSVKLFIPAPPPSTLTEVSSDHHFITSLLQDFWLKVLEGRTHGKMINKQELCRNVLIERAADMLWNLAAARTAFFVVFCFVLSHLLPSRKKGFSGLWFSVSLKRKNQEPVWFQWNISE